MARPKGSKNKPKLLAPPEVVARVAKVTPAQKMQLMRRQVALCVADRMTEVAIAEVVGITLDKLRAVFPRELRYGREIVRAEELLRLDAASSVGNVPASKAILAAAADPTDAHSELGRGDATNPENEAVTRAALRVLNGGKSDAK